MTVTTPSTLPPPVRTFSDAATGVAVHQLTQGDEPAAPLYFTRPSWTADGRWFVHLRQRGRSVNLYACGPGGELRQLTRFPPPPGEPAYVTHMHRRFRVEEGPRIMMRIPAMHPTRAGLAFSLGNDIHWSDVEAGTDEVIFTFPPQHALTPDCPLHTAFTADGRELIFTTNVPAKGRRIDPPQRAWDFSLRDESDYVGRIWRYDFESRRMIGEVFVSNGEQSHVLTCPWDAERIVWLNYLHGRLYAMRRDGTDLRELLPIDEVGHASHCNWDTANRRLVVCLSDVKANWRTTIASLDLDSGDLRRFGATTLPHPCHPGVSPEGRWIVLDVADRRIEGTQGLHLLDQREDRLHPLCRCTWGALSDKEGRPVKSEFLHPNPGFSPDGRYVVFGSDYGSLVAQIFAADLSTWRPGGGA